MTHTFLIHPTPPPPTLATPREVKALFSAKRCYMTNDSFRKLTFKNWHSFYIEIQPMH